MMDDIKLDAGDSPDSLAYILPTDFIDGRDIIYFGGGVYPKFDRVLSTEEKMVENIETVITHESAHLVIYKVTNNIDTVRRLDRIDRAIEGNPISQSL